jgi:hypothetical protein
VQYENAACAGALTFLTEATDVKILHKYDIEVYGVTT